MWSTGSLRAGAGISVFILIWAILYRQNTQPTYTDTNTSIEISVISRHLLELEKSITVQGKPKVAVGYGACYDIYANMEDVLGLPSSSIEPLHYEDVSSVSELFSSFAYYFRHGAAAERFTSNETLFDELVSLAEKSDNSRWAVGGNAPVMAMRFLREGAEVILAAKGTAKLRAALPEQLNMLAGEAIKKDDVHLIFEYKAQSSWGPFTAPRANRYILHNDQNNPMMSAVEPFDAELLNFKPNLLVVSGLQMMDSYPYNEGVREKRLSKIREQMISQHSNTLIHFEMASYVETKLMDDLTKMIIPHADSLGMNEQELTNLYNILQYGNISVVADSNPRVAVALDQMRKVFKLVSQNKEGRKLTRIHVHTLAYQAIMTVKGSPWKETIAATAKASLTAHRHVCGSDSILLDSIKLVMDDSFSTSTKKHRAERVSLNPEKPVSCWEETLKYGENVNVQVCVAPVLVCTNVQQTAGAGDNISAAGLVLQI